MATIETTVTRTANGLVIEGTPLTDILEGQGGDDFLYGFEGADRLTGNGGDDTLDGGAALDWMEGGAGDDTYVVDVGPSGGPILFASAGTPEPLASTSASAGAVDSDAPVSSPPVAGSSGGAASPAAASYGLYGALPSVPSGDVIVEADGSAGGRDTVEQRTPLHVMWDGVEDLRMAPEAYDARGNGLGNAMSGNVNTNFLLGGGGGDAIFGDQGDDHLEGGAGDDVVVGGGGIDFVWGGPGGDTFRFDRVEETVYSPGLPFDPLLPERDGDRIMDFRSADGDRIDLGRIDANADAAGEQAFAWRGDGAFTGAGQIRTEADPTGTRTVVQLNTDADGDPEGIIVLIGRVAPTAGDFVL
ncbi:MAG TPA: hypothetical protein VEY95_16275 [Azospirillaceae bacterium]|nr:hypothetical protein [Azospirillaceae bacterium]